jgi:hypothetical protein
MIAVLALSSVVYPLVPAALCVPWWWRNVCFCISFSVQKLLIVENEPLLRYIYLYHLDYNFEIGPDLSCTMLSRY